MKDIFRAFLLTSLLSLSLSLFFYRFMERNYVRTAYRTSLTTPNTKIVGGGGGGGGSERNKVCRAGEEDEDDLKNGVSWPPRSYTCNFCKREFRSAQALGGHMNVHRRDRALLYSPQSTTTTTTTHHHHHAHFTNLNLNLNYNPNPNLPCYDGRLDRKANLDLKLEINEIVIKPRACNDWNKTEKFIGYLDIHDSNKDIDLELRLGYSA